MLAASGCREGETHLAAAVDSVESAGADLLGPLASDVEPPTLVVGEARREPAAVGFGADPMGVAALLAHGAAVAEHEEE
jgi:hypothetical protein